MNHVADPFSSSRQPPMELSLLSRVMKRLYPSYRLNIKIIDVRLSVAELHVDFIVCIEHHIVFP
jgi:hypothetical protein